MQRMAPLDTWFLHVEDEADHMHIGSVGVFEGPPPAWQDLLGAIGARLEFVPRYRQRFQPVPLGLARPVWVDDPHFHLEYHVRHTALPRPGGFAQLRKLVGRVMGQQLDRRRPLWETWFIEGLEGDRWAMLTKVHHCVVDGIAGTDLLAAILSADPAEEVAPPGTWQPQPTPSPVALLRDAAAELLTQPSEQWRALRAAARRPRAAARGVASGLHGLAEFAGLARPLPACSLTGPIGPHRRWATAHTTLAELKAVRRALGGTVNDVALAAITAGYRDLLAKRGELHKVGEVRTMVPVSLRAEHERGEYHNRVSALFVPLPVTVSDARERYERVRDTMRDMKASGEEVAVAALIDLSGMAPHMFVGLALRSATLLVQRSGQPFVSSVTTNVPGPQHPLYLLGRRMLAAYPYVPIGEGLRTGVAIFSYDGQLTFGVTADYDRVPDVEVLADGIERGVAELVDLIA